MEDAMTRVEALESALREAVLAGDVEVLDRLLADDVIYTDPSGAELTKADDLATHAAGQLKVDVYDVRDRKVRVIGEVAVVMVRARLAGRFAGKAFAGEFVYTRVWAVERERGALVAAACTAVPSRG